MNSCFYFEVSGNIVIKLLILGNPIQNLEHFKAEFKTTPKKNSGERIENQPADDRYPALLIAPDGTNNGGATRNNHTRC